ncbi:hypothetical protein LTSEBAI_3078 [Salmonella enterica subsp. enterica serovar Baildon str. R6-199]|nr:hypothetical protein LTSEBAI_3078 [Salmonella enterica subsp. enterica serovar Baildon str. R6-199]
MTHVTSAIIVGGGIGGAATALSLSLARQGIPRCRWRARE